MFDPDIHLDVPTCNLLVEIGVDPAAASEVIAEDRAIRCPDRDRVVLDRDAALLDVATPLDGAPCGATAIPGRSRRQADWS